jgi:hypothetical protein
MKNTLMILVVGALLGTMLVGCGTPTEGNGNGPDGTVPSTKSGDAKAAGVAGMEGETPAANTPAPGADMNKPAMDANAPAADANKPAGK